MSDFLDAMAASSAERARALRSQAGTLITLAARAPVPLPLALGTFGVIAEVKPRSPSTGSLGDGSIDAAVSRARAYAAGGAACVSVLTEPTRFGGSIEHLASIAEALRESRTPVMRKDFLVDPLQVTEARAFGASGVLLVVRMLDDARLAEICATARDLGMFALLEAFDEIDLDRADDAALIGINTRDLRTLAVDRSRLARLAPRIRRRARAIAESGIETPEDARYAAGLGYAGVLVGTMLMQARDPAAAVRALRVAPSREETTPCT